MASRAPRRCGNRQSRGSGKETGPGQTPRRAEVSHARRQTLSRCMREVRIPACAKINLRLEVLGKRADGYHELRTIFQTVSLHDTLEFRPSRRPGISLQIQGNEALAKEAIEKNLVYRAVDALRRESHVRPGVEITLQKKIPAGRGLGGGSRHAAAALLGH